MDKSDTPIVVRSRLDTTGQTKTKITRWHTLESNEVLKLLKTDPAFGLSDAEIANRQNQYGKNVLPKGQRVTALQMFLGQFKSPLVYILLIAAVLTWVIGDRSDSIVIAIVVITNALIGLFQEHRANKIFEKLKETVRVQAIVVRGGKISEVDSEEVVPGDMIILKSGNKVPADARIVSNANLEVNEALLTGESRSVTKSLDLVPEQALVGDRKNMVFMGTVVERGEGQAVVAATGSETEIGKITLLTQQTTDELSPLQERVKRLGTFLTELFVIISAAIFLIGLAEGDPIFEMIKTTVAVAVAAIPEGLPAAISIILAVSSQNILRRKGLVRRLVAAETLGSTSVICTDKTGTLTYGVMKVEEIIGRDQDRAILALALANEAIIEEKNGSIVVRGESTDKAKLEKFLEHGSLENANRDLPRLAILPFEESRKYIASFHNNKNDGSLQIFVNGAPEAILNKCHLNDFQKQGLRETYENYAKRGFRLLGIAEKTDRLPQNREWTIPAMETYIRSLKFLGFAAIRDPIREDVKKTIMETRDAGIKVLMVTGDHLLTAKAIGLELGFATSGEAVISGEELDKLSDQTLARRIEKLEVVARVTPVHKMRIIAAWQKLGAVVAMTGDGVNDAPALKAADIGVAIGSGTDVSKEAADLVLLDDSFSTITAAVKEGRASFTNIRKATVAVMSNAFTEIILITSNLVFQIPFFPITAIQILWVNLAEDSLPVLAMAFEPAEDGVMKSKPISPNEPILNREHKFIIFAVSFVSDVILAGIFFYLAKYSAWQKEVIQSFIFVAAATPTLFNVFAFKSFKTPIYRINLLNNKLLIASFIIGMGLMLVAIYVPFFNSFLNTRPLALYPALFAFLAFPLFKLALVEITKWWYRHHEL